MIQMRMKASGLWSVQSRLFLFKPFSILATFSTNVLFHKWKEIMLLSMIECVWNSSVEVVFSISTFKCIFLHYYLFTLTEVQNTENTLICLCCHLLLTDDIGYVAVVAVAAVNRGEGGGIAKVGWERVEASGQAQCIRGATFELALVQSSRGIG